MTTDNRTTEIVFNEGQDTHKDLISFLCENVCTSQKGNSILIRHPKAGVICDAGIRNLLQTLFLKDAIQGRREDPGEIKFPGKCRNAPGRVGAMVPGEAVKVIKRRGVREFKTTDDGRSHPVRLVFVTKPHEPSE